MKILVNAAAAKIGGAATYLENFTRVAQAQSEHQFTLLVDPSGERRSEGSVTQIPAPARATTLAGRLAIDQLDIPMMSRDGRFDGLVSSGNFGTLASPCRQLLLIRNPIYFSKPYLERVESVRRDLLPDLLLRRGLVAASILAADAVAFPTAAMRDEVAERIRIPPGRCRVIPHGFDADVFVSRADGRFVEDDRFRAGSGPRLLVVSHYALHKDFRTLFEGFRRFREAQPGALLVLTADLQRRRTELLVEEWALFDRLRSENAVLDLGTVPYAQVPSLYRACDLFVFSSLAESFGHPLMEAMAMGLPVVASGIGVHREICGPAADYFLQGDPKSLAETLSAVTERPIDERRIEQGRARAQRFTWEQHLRGVLDALKGW
ncbi:MAG: glycosyltransferase family 4 protein [Deltaproteobacteria bacterium]